VCLDHGPKSGLNVLDVFTVVVGLNGNMMKQTYAFNLFRLKRCLATSPKQ
jgi:hypothetical protein